MVPLHRVDMSVHCSGTSYARSLLHTLCLAAILMSSLPSAVEEEEDEETQAQAPKAAIKVDA